MEVTQQNCIMVLKLKSSDWSLHKKIGFQRLMGHSKNNEAYVLQNDQEIIWVMLNIMKPKCDYQHK